MIMAMVLPILGAAELGMIVIRLLDKECCSTLENPPLRGGEQVKVEKARHFARSGISRQQNPFFGRPRDGSWVAS
jgi:hypothetical protein